MTVDNQELKALCRAPHVAWRRIADDTVLLDLKRKHIYALNETAGYFWHALNGHRQVDELLQLIGPSAPEKLEGQLIDFLDELMNLKLVASGPDNVGSETTLKLEKPSTILPPSVVWQEEMKTAIGFSCAFLPGENSVCDTGPYS